MRRFSGGDMTKKAVLKKISYYEIKPLLLQECMKKFNSLSVYSQVQDEKTYPKI